MNPRRLLLNALVGVSLLLATSVGRSQPMAAEPERQACRLALQAASVRDSLPTVLKGDERAFAELREAMPQVIRLLAGSQAASVSVQQHVDQLLARQSVVLQAAQALAAIPQQADPLLAAIDTLYSAEVVAAAPSPRLAAANQLGILSQRLGRSALEMVSSGRLSAEAVYRLAKDTASFRRLLAGLTDGDAELRLPPARSAASKAQLAAVAREFATLKLQVDRVLGSLKEVVAAWEAQALLMLDLQALGRQAGAVCLQSAAASAR